MKRDPVVVITGASAGIGEALAREVSKRGARTVLLARRVERLASLAHELGGPSRSLALACDVTADGDLERALTSAVEAFGAVDYVVANAGFGVEGGFDTLSLEDFRRQFETNFFGVVRTAMASSAPLERSKGVFAVVGSVAGYLAGPGVGAYNASKFAVRGLCETLHAEWAHRGIAVLHVAPGFIETDIRRTDRHGVFHEDRRDPIPRWLQQPAPQAAREIADALEGRRAEVVLTLHGRVGVCLARRAPWLIRAVGRLSARPRRG